MKVKEVPFCGACGDCKFWDYRWKSQQMGICDLVPFARWERKGEIYEAFKATNFDDCCGEWQNKEIKP